MIDRNNLHCPVTGLKVDIVRWINDEAMIVFAIRRSDGWYFEAGRYRNWTLWRSAWYEEGRLEDEFVQYCMTHTNSELLWLQEGF